jgi:hypothetical protein
MACFRGFKGIVGKVFWGPVKENKECNNLGQTRKQLRRAKQKRKERNSIAHFFLLFLPGQQCNIKCAYGTYGQNCLERCKCQNGGNCDHISGACSCPAGWKGAL